MKKLDYEIQNAHAKKNSLLINGKGTLNSVNKLLVFANGRLDVVKEDSGDVKDVLLDLEDVCEEMRCIETLTFNDPYSKVDLSIFSNVSGMAHHVENYLNDAIRDIRSNGLGKLDEYVSWAKARTALRAERYMPDIKETSLYNY